MNRRARKGFGTTQNTKGLSTTFSKTAGSGSAAPKPALKEPGEATQHFETGLSVGGTPTE